jgi:lysine/ornithine N-monooxygenase
VKIQSQHHQITINKLILLFFLISFFGYSQNTDNQLRLAASIDYKINKKWKVGVDYRYALEKDISTFQANVFQVAGEYKINKKMTIEAGYRFLTSYERDNQRLFASFIYDNKISRFNIRSRTRYQFSTPYFDTEFWNDFRQPSQILRQRLSVDYDIPKSKLSLNLSSEIFFKCDNPELKSNRIRYQLGGDYNLKYGNAVGFSVFYEDRTNPQKTDRFVFSTKYSLSIDEMLKKLAKKRTKTPSF